MRAVQRKARLYVVIERPNIPGNGVVAGVAALMEIAVMRVVFTMAGHTIAFFVTKRLCGMAVFALILIV
jgi:hypothetical protein